MERTARIAIVGDYDAGMYTHRAIDDALGHTLESRGRAVESTWVGTEAIDADPRGRLAEIDGIWLAPASPYRSTEGALAAVRLARESKIPFLGVCGGFQHTVMEFARNVLGVADAQHAEVDAAAPHLIVTPLACDLIGRSGVVFLDPGSHVAAIYGRWRIVERYHCAYGLNADYVAVLARAGMHVTGRDEQGDARVVELAGHPFFVATLFQPQLSSGPSSPAPLVRAFVDAAIGHRDGGLPPVDLADARFGAGRRSGATPKAES
jgi:CTP synthase (UTP-ammonia lyase)